MYITYIFAPIHQNNLWRRSCLQMRKLRLRKQNHLAQSHTTVAKGAGVVLRTIVKAPKASKSSSSLTEPLPSARPQEILRVHMSLFPKNWSQRYDQVPKHIPMRKELHVIQLHPERQSNHQLGRDGQKLKQGVRDKLAGGNRYRHTKR